MSEGITKEEYDDEVQSQAEILAEHAMDAFDSDEYDDPLGAVMELSSDVLDHHNWFARSYHGPADHGAIIEYAEDSGVDPVRYRDLTPLAESEDPTRVVKNFAYVAFESHVIDLASELVKQ